MHKSPFKKQSVSMNAARERKRLESDPPDHPVELPYLRKTIIIIDHDFEKTQHVLNLYRTKRNDQYKVVCDGQLWKNNICLSEIFRLIRKSMPRVRGLLN